MVDVVGACAVVRPLEGALMTPDTQVRAARLIPLTDWHDEAIVRIAMDALAAELLATVRAWLRAHSPGHITIGYHFAFREPPPAVDPLAVPVGTITLTATLTEHEHAHAHAAEPAFASAQERA